MLRNICIFIFSLLVYANSQQNFDQYYNEVNNLIKQTQQYTLPTSNEELYRTSDPRTYTHGTFDFIIVGGGSAGSALANRLSEIRGASILLLEAGGAETPLSDIPAYNGYTAKSPLNWGYYTTPQKNCCQGMINKQCLYPRGKVLGGSATINALIYARGSPVDFNNWEKMGNTGWGYQSVLPYFKKSEHADIDNPDPGFHGFDGFLHVNYSRPPSVISDTFFKGNAEMGIKELDYNGRTQFGVSKIQFNINDRRRDDGGHAYIDPVRNRKNLHISLHSFVIKVLLCGKTAKGVEFVKDGKKYVAYARREVILSGGSVNTPQLLMLSGVGPKAELEKFNIPVKKDLPVGKNMEDHVMYINLYVRTNQKAENLTLREQLERYLRGETPLTFGAGCEHISFVNTAAANKAPPDIEYLTVPQPNGLPGDAKFFYNFDDTTLEGLKNVNALTDFRILIVLLKPKSRGSVTLQSNSARDFPLIDINYFSDANNEDIETLYRGIEYILKIVDTKAFKDVDGSIVDTVTGCDNFKKNSKEYWFCAIKQTASTIYHPAGTTRMGRSETNSVVTPDLLVHGFKNLRVVDAGVIPEIVSGHPNASVFMIAEKAADIIKAAWLAVFG